MKTVTKAVFSVALLATIFSWQLYSLGQEPEHQHQDKTFQQYMEDSSDKDPQVRLRAEDALNVMYSEAESYDYSTVQQCIDHLKNKNGAVRLRAVWALGKMGPKAKDAIPALLEAIQDNGSFITMHLCGALQCMKPEFTASLQEILQDKKANVKARRSAGMFLSNIKPYSKQTFAMLVRIIKDKKEDTIVRSSVCANIWENESDTEQIVSELIEVFQMQDEDTQVRFNAAWALKCRFNRPGGHRKEIIIQVFLKAVQKEDELPEIRGTTAMLLGEIDREGKRAIPVFIEILRNQDQHEYVHLGTMRGLAIIGPAAKEAVPLLKEMSNHKNENISKLAAEALKSINVKEQKKPLQQQSLEQRDEEPPIPSKPEDR